MVDFLKVSWRSTKRGIIEIYPKFVVKNKSKDLMIRGSDFYAIWLEELGLWSTDEQDVIDLVDRELDKFADDFRKTTPDEVHISYMWDAESGSIDRWHKFCQKQLRDSFHSLDEKLIFANSPTNKKDYASKRLPYSLEPGDYSSFDKLIGTLYSPEERHKIEWAIGSIVSGDSKSIQKFLVLYGSGGTGKSTILGVIAQLFEGYCTTFNAKDLGDDSRQFALEQFKTNPLVAIQHDGNLSKIKDNSRLNSLISHELMSVNEKFKPTYSQKFNTFLFMGTNSPVEITDSRSGLIRRLIDVSPSGNLLPPKEYNQVRESVKYELGAIAYHCLEVYESDKGFYDTYIPIKMMDSTNDFYNFVSELYFEIKKEDGITLNNAYEQYKNFCESSLTKAMKRTQFKEELKNYFENYEERTSLGNGERVRSYYSGFKYDKMFIRQKDEVKEEEEYVIDFSETKSILDDVYSDCLAQYAKEDGSPETYWDNVKTTLKDIDTSKVHYVLPKQTHIVIDFDLKDENGNKSYELNLKAASKWPKTYAELSKSGQGIHLHYIYNGDVSKLSKLYDTDIEIKVFTGKSALRRKLTKCNKLAIAVISSGLPLKVTKMVNKKIIQNEEELVKFIEKNLRKEIWSNTKCSIDYIYKILDDAYTSGMPYDVTHLKPKIIRFASGSTNQAITCLKIVSKMKFKSEVEYSNDVPSDKELFFFDIEVIPNLLLICYKKRGKDNKVIRMYNPSPEEVWALFGNNKYCWVGYNCRKYDNHIVYARGKYGYSIEECYKLSKRIIENQPNSKFPIAYNLSYTDIYDFASAGNKMSLKKLEILMRIHHKELGMDWDTPIPEDKWQEVGDYCENDVIASEAAFDFLENDFATREILADIAGMTCNDTTNSLTTKIIFEGNKSPQNEFYYRNLAEPVLELDSEIKKFLDESCPEMMSIRHGDANSLLPYFPGYKYEKGVSIYRNEEVGEGGYVYAEPGMYYNVALLDVASMHPHSAIAECHFGPYYTRRFKSIVDGRIAIKHNDWDATGKVLDGKLTKYVEKIKDGVLKAKVLATALKTPINSVYGLTSATFANPFLDKRNVDNIVAKRGALFMIDLKNEVQNRGYTVIHIKTDSIKIANADDDIIKFVMDFGKKYGYEFEHEATYSKMCIVNDAVYIARYDEPHEGKWWTATGKQFAVPYLFKTLFSKEPIEFYDMCETFQVNGSLYLDFDEDLPENEHNYNFVGKVGQFCPIKEGAGGGKLYRYQDGKYSAATGSKGYRWLESEVVKTLGREDDIDISFYRRLIDNAVADISKYGDFDWFVSDSVDDPERHIYNNKTEELPWSMPCGKNISCFDCDAYKNSECLRGYDISTVIK